MVRKKYDKAYKLAAVKQVIEEGKKVSHVAKALGILPTMLSRWVYEFETHGDEAFTGNGKPIANKDLEIKRLQNRLEELEMENEILKKVSGLLKGAREAKYAFVLKHTKRYPVVLMCRILNISPQAYYGWKKRRKSRRAIDREKFWPNLIRAGCIGQESGIFG